MNKALFKKNLQWLQKNNNQLYHKIKSIVIKNTYVVKNEAGRDILVKNVNGINYPLYSLYNDNAQCRQWMEQFENISTDLFVVYGLGLGYELEILLKTDISTPLFIIEPDYEAFYYFLHCCDITLLGKSKVEFIIGDSIDDCLLYFRYIVEKHYIKRFHIIPQSGYYYIYKDIINDLHERMKEVLTEIIVSINTSLAAASKWMYNRVVNLNRQMGSSMPVEKLKGLFTNVPAILVSAGPSLEEDLECIKSLYDRALIVAVGSGLSVLESQGVRGHIVGALDGNFTELEIFKNIAVNKDIFLLYTSIVFPEVPAVFRKEKLFFPLSSFDNYIYKQLDQSPMPVTQGFSIAVSALDILAQIGCNPIFLTGQDFCYSREQSYAKGATYYYSDVKQSSEFPHFMQVKNKKGEDVYTKTAFWAMKTAMEKVVAGHKNTKVFNCSQIGLSIRGTTDVVLADIAQQYFTQRYQFPEQLERIYAEYQELPKKASKSAITESIKAEVPHIMVILLDIIGIIEESFNCDLTNSTKVSEKVGIFEQQLEKCFFYTLVLRQEYEIIHYLFQQITIEGINKLPLKLRSSVLELEKKRRFYGGIYDLCLTIQKAFETDAGQGG